MTSEGLGKLDFDSKSVGELIKTQHKVPQNQREFSWETKNVEDLLNDITTAKESEQGEYFLGTIVLVRSEDTLMIVDGQQRITTIYIVISAIRDYLVKTKDKDNNERADELQSRYLYKRDLTTLEIEPYFTLNETDNELFQTGILDRDGNFDGMDKHKPSHVLLENAYSIVSDHVKRAAEAPPNNVAVQLMSIVDYLEEYVHVLVATATDESKAFILFETLNDRGLDLAVSDLLKNYLLGRAGTKISAVKKSWSSMQSALEAVDSADKITLYIMHLWCSKYGAVREREIFSAIKNEIKIASKVVKFSLHLESEVKRYIAIITADKNFWTDYDHNTWLAMRTLNLLKQVQPRPLLLSIINNFSKNDVIKAMMEIENMAVRYSVTGSLGGARMEKFYSDLALGVNDETISSAEDLIKKLKTNIPSDEDFKSSFSKISLARPALARYYLIELEKIKEGNDKVPNEDVKEVNLEHILPKIFPDSGWEKFTEEEHKMFYKKLGNLTLMNSKDNSSSDRDPFLDKVKYYKKSSLSVTKEIEVFSEWNADAIQKRQKELSELAVKRW